MRTVSRAAVVAAALALIVSALPPAAQAGVAPGKLGTVTGLAPLPEALRLTGAGHSWLVHYRSTAWNGRPTVVSGTITIPSGRPPRNGWPVVSFGHGFSGTADICAPSYTGPSPWERAVQETLLSAGYAVVVTDYDGIGTPGESSVVDGPSQAYAMIDIVRAARTIAPLSRRWAAVGYSLGGYTALFAADLATTYAPELRQVGTIALAPIIAHGTLDQIPVVLTEVTAAQLAAPGTDVTLTEVPGADHITLLPTVAPQVLTWTDSLFER